MPKGYLSFILHSHLPWVLNHGKWPHGTDWLNEAAAGCYLPLLEQLDCLISQEYTPHINVGITPILQEQLHSANFKEEFCNYIQQRQNAAEQDHREFVNKGQEDFARVAVMWQQHFAHIHDLFVSNYDQNILDRFKTLQDRGNIEIMTSAATHGYLPLLKNDRSVNAQINLGAQTYQHHFNRKPQGIWLPECAYRPSYPWKSPIGKKSKATNRKGIDEFLSRHDIDYFITDAHLLQGGKAIGTYISRFKALKQLWSNFQRTFEVQNKTLTASPQEVYLVASNPGIKPVAILTRDPTTALQVWSGKLGYPGESAYLDFHKKRFPGGLRYWRVTDPKIDLALKQVYEPDRVEQKLQEHAAHFVSLVRATARTHYKKHHKPASICVPFDTELFGHWWFEGPRWLYYVLKTVQEDEDIELSTGSNLLKVLHPDTIIALPEGSWGEGGFHYVWLNKFTSWTWKRLYEVEDIFYRLLDTYKHSDNKHIIAVLKQMSRELLLLQSSDWQFLITTWSARDYAELRFSRHYDMFKQLASILTQYGRKSEFPDNALYFIEEVSQRDNCFPDLDLSIFDI